MRHLRTSDERGAAMAEMALSMLVMIPLIWYALMLDDLLIYRLNEQETVLSATWDLTAGDYRDKDRDNPKEAGHLTRLMYCDHSAAYDQSVAYDCQGSAHHVQRTGHQCWLQNPPGASEVPYGADKKTNQVQCTMVDGALGNNVTDLSGVFGKFAGNSEYNAGGHTVCFARLNVLNGRMPTGFMQKFSSQKMMAGSSGLEGRHASAHDTGSSTVFQFPWYYSSILTDSWAVNKSSDLDPEKDAKSDPLWKRVNTVYHGSWLWPVYNGLQIGFRGMLVAKQLVLPFKDDPGRTWVGVKFGTTGNRAGVQNGKSSKETPTRRLSEEGGSPGYHLTPWLDWSGDRYKGTWNDTKRGHYYLGCKNAESC